MDWLVGILGSGCIAGMAYWKKSLSASGMLAAIMVGTVLYAIGSVAWFATLIAFFVSSSVLSKWKQSKKETIETVYEKTGRRDAGQVLANGGLAVVFCVANYIHPNPIWWAFFIGVMASVNADTWATEIGSLSKGLPRSILTGKNVPRGTSGGISGLGLLASAAGGLFIGAVAWAFAHFGAGKTDQSAANFGDLLSIGSLLVVGTIAGICGSLADSLIGARWQALFHCTVCGKEVEGSTHCGKRTEHIRGLKWMNNDAVNLLSSFIGGAIAVVMSLLI